MPDSDYALVIRPDPSPSSPEGARLAAIAAIERAMQTHDPECDLNHLDISEMQDISNTFEGTAFVGDVSTWQVGSMRDMRHLFADCPFSGDLSKWDVNPRIHLDGMLSPTFRGILPLLANEPQEERTAVYITMFGGVDNYDQYLAAQPFGKLHAAYLIDTERSPPWLTLDELNRINEVRSLGLGLGLTYDALCTLIHGTYQHAPSGVVPESLSIEFDQ